MTGPTTKPYRKGSTWPSSQRTPKAIGYCFMENVPEETLESRYHYRGRVVALRLDTVSLGEDATTLREIVEHGQSVVLVPVDWEGKVLLVRQFRKPVEDWLLEAPAGGLEDGESAEACAQRELREETGYQAGRLVRLGGFHASPGYCTEFLHMFVALGLSASPLTGDVDEAIEVVRLSWDEALAQVRSEGIRDAKTLAALWMYSLWREGVPS